MCCIYIGEDKAKALCYDREEENVASKFMCDFDIGKSKAEALRYIRATTV